MFVDLAQSRDCWFRLTSFQAEGKMDCELGQGTEQPFQSAAGRHSSGCVGQVAGLRYCKGRQGQESKSKSQGKKAGFSCCPCCLREGHLNTISLLASMKLLYHVQGGWETQHRF